MAFLAGAPSGRNRQTNSLGSHSGGDSGDWAEPQEEPRDWKKIVLVIGLGALSWAATYIGMLELIQANVGDLPIAHKILIGFSVAMLMTMIIWLLDQIFSPVNYGTKFLFVIGYIFLTVISVGFGFGFYWKVLESRSESTRSAESAISGVQNALHAGFTRMQALNQTLLQLETVSKAKAVEEREKGTSCPNSRPGDGPRRKLRDADAQSFLFASQFVTRRVGSVQTELTALDADLKKVTSGDATTFDARSGTRNDFMRDLNRRLDLTVTGFNTFRTDPQLRQIRSDLNDRAAKTVFPNTKGGTFSCPDAQLQAALRGVVRAIDQLPEMTKPKIAAVEGSEATIEAFRRLTASIFGILTLTPPLTPDELRQLQKKAVQSVSESGSSAPPAYAPPTGLGKRDYVPLAIAVFVDLCLLLVSIGRPMNRLNSLIPKMREAEQGPVIKILSRFNEIHRDPEIRQNFEVFRHVVFDYLGDYYVAVPLDTPYNRVGNGQASYYGSDQAQELQHEAHLLSNLFASFEKERIFKRVYFMPSRVVSARLRRQGSKFAGSSAFRLYRFKDGAWSDIILGAVMGAAKRVEAEKALRAANQQQQIKDRGPSLNPRDTTAVPNRRKTGKDTPLAAGGIAPGPNGSGEAGPSGKAPPMVLRQMADARSGTSTQNGAGPNGFHANGNSSDVPGPFRASTPNAIFIDEEFGDDDFGFDDFSDETLKNLTPEEEEQIRSRYGKYADKILAERTGAASNATDPLATEAEIHDASKAGEGETGTETEAGVHAMPDLTEPELKDAAANSNTLPPSGPQFGIVNGTSNGAEKNAVATSKVIALPSSQPVANDLPRALSQMDGTALKPSTMVAGQPSRKTINTAETTVTLTRETATYTVPVSEAVLPLALRQSAASASPVVLPQTMLKDEPTEFGQPENVVIDALARAIPTQAVSHDIEPAPAATEPVSAAPVKAGEPIGAPMLLTPPPLPE